MHSSKAQSFARDESAADSEHERCSHDGLLMLQLGCVHECVLELEAELFHETWDFHKGLATFDLRGMVEFGYWLATFAQLS